MFASELVLKRACSRLCDFVFRRGGVRSVVAAPPGIDDGEWLTRMKGGVVVASAVWLQLHECLMTAID